MESIMDVMDLKVFILSKDYEVLKLFYLEIGFDFEYVIDDFILF